MTDTFLPPDAADIERAVIGAMLNNLNEFEASLDLFDETLFYRSEHRIVYMAILTLWKKDKGIDLLGVIELLKADGSIDRIGGMESFWGITQECYSTANFKSWSEILNEKKRQRELLLLSHEIEKEIMTGTAESKELINRVLERADRISGDRTSENVKTIGDCVTPAMRNIETRSKTTNGTTGIPTGFGKLDRATAGWQPGNFIVLAAATKAGKSALGLAFALTAAEHGFPTVIYSLEMTDIEIAERGISFTAQYETTAVHYNQPSQSEWDRMLKACSKLSNLPLYLDATPGLNITELAAKAKRMKQKHGIALVVVDYMQLMGGLGEHSRQLQVENISRGLKRLAMGLNIPVIGISQFSRPVKGQEKMRPMLSWLRDSGAIEQDANIVLFIHDPSEDEKRAQLDVLQIPHSDIEFEELREIIIAANRQGATMDILVKWEGRFFKFSNPC